MKLLFYIPGLVDGGAERVMATLASHFAKDGNQISLAVDFETDRDLKLLDQKVEVIPLPNGHLGALRELAKLLASGRFELAISAIAANNFKLAIAALLARFAKFIPKQRATKKPAIVLTYHGFEEYKTGWMSWLGYVSLPLISRTASKVIAVSDSLADDLRKRWKASPRTLQRIYNPVEVPTSSRSLNNDEQTNKKKMILSVGRLVPDKRFDLLIEAFSELKTEEAELVILGDGPERQRLEQVIHRLELSTRVTLPGYVTDTTPYYEQASCFALTSRQESFGLVLVEALAQGLPIISTDSGGPREVLDNGRYGQLLKADASKEDLAAALADGLEDSEDPAPRLARAQEFNLERGMSQYSELFKQLLSQGD